MNALWVSFAHQNHEWGLVNDSLLRQCMPVRSHEATLLESLRVAVDRKNRDLGFHALQDLVSHGFRSGERRGEVNVLPVLLFPLRDERRIDCLFQRLFHDRKAVERDIGTTAGFRRRLWQTTAAD